MLWSLPLVVVLPVLLFQQSVKLPYSISTYAEVLPHKKWILAKGSNGIMTSNLVDYETGMTNNFAFTQFQRGEAIVFSLSDKLSGRKYIALGDTIGELYSTDLAERITELQGELSVAKAELSESQTGEKVSMVAEAENRIKYAQARLEERQKVFERTEQLYKKGFATQEEYDLIASEVKQLQIEIEISRAQLQTASSGLKKESIELLRQKVSALGASLELLKKRSKSYVFTSPVSGVVSRTFSSDTVLTIIDYDEVLLNVPLKLSYAQSLKEGDDFEILLSGYDKPVTGRVISLSPVVKFLHYQQVITATILMNNQGHRLLPGMVTEGQIMLEPLSVLEHLKNFIMK